MNDTDPAADGLERAMNFEEEGIQFFQSACNHSGCSAVRKVFEELENAGKNHLEDLSELLERISMGFKWPSGFHPRSQVLSFNIIFDGKKPEIVDGHKDQETILLAMEMEQSGCSLYRKLQLETDNRCEKDFYAVLQIEEESHYQVLSDLHDELDCPPVCSRRGCAMCRSGRK